jgi:hypothetical protein
MALIPDIAAHGLRFMNFFFHLEKGLPEVENFWKERGVPERDGLAYFEVAGLNTPYTISVQWRPSGDDCCDIRLSIDADSADDLGYPQAGDYRISEQDFKDFFDYARQKNVNGILARYGASLHGDWTFFEMAKNAQVKRLVIEIGEEKTKVEVDFERLDDASWQVTVQPSWLLGFLKTPVSDDFFAVPLQTAVALLTPLLNEKGDSHAEGT